MTLAYAPYHLAALDFTDGSTCTWRSFGGAENEIFLSVNFDDSKFVFYCVDRRRNVCELQINTGSLRRALSAVSWSWSFSSHSI